MVDLYLPKRHVTISLTCLGMCIVHAMRVNIAVTVVTILDRNPHEKVGTITAIFNLPNVIWDSNMVGFLHAVFYIGYLVTQLPGGYLATKYPANNLFGMCILCSCLLNLLLPVAIYKVGYSLTCVIRGLQGLFEGLLFPSCYAILRHWTTPQERSCSGAVVLTGVYLGPVIGLSVSGYITHFVGWQYVYYIFGCLGAVWAIGFFCFTYESPAKHPTISQDELKLILESQGETAIIYEHDRVPWRDIFLSMPVNALNVCNFARSFVFFLLLTNEPAYLNAFGYSLAENGILSSLPHLGMTLFAAASGPLADWLIVNPMLNRTQVRKIFTGLGFGTEAVCCFILYFTDHGLIAVIYLTIGVGFSGLTISGWQINHLDIAPRYASVLVGITTAAGTLAGILNPLIVGALTVNQTLDNWQDVFVLTAAILAFAVVFYAIFGSGEKQEWSEPRPERVTLVTPGDPLKNKPYYTVTAQAPGPGDSTNASPTEEDANVRQRPSSTSEEKE